MILLVGDTVSDAGQRQQLILEKAQQSCALVMAQCQSKQREANDEITHHRAELQRVQLAHQQSLTVAAAALAQKDAAAQEALQHAQRVAHEAQVTDRERMQALLAQRDADPQNAIQALERQVAQAESDHIADVANAEAKRTALAAVVQQKLQKDFDDTLRSH